MSERSLFTAGGLIKALVRVVVLVCILGVVSVGIGFMASNSSSPALAFAFHSSLVDQGLGGAAVGVLVDRWIRTLPTFVSLPPAYTRIRATRYPSI